MLKFSGVFTIDDLPRLACDVLSQLEEPFGLSLIGPLGVGKTALVREMFLRLGLDPSSPVQSPTFTYVNEYHIAGKRYLHLDLYRVPTGFDFEDLVDRAEVAGIFVEWAAAMPEFERDLVLTHALELSFTGDASRRYELRRL